MKIRKAQIGGFQGVASADIELGRVNVFVGANGSGKTTMLEALLMPIFGTARAPKKKDFPKMIMDGARSAEIRVIVEDSGSGEKLVHDLQVKIMKSRTDISPLKGSIGLFDQILIDPLSFFDLPPKIKADLVADVPLDRDKVRQALLDRHVLEPVLDDVVNVIMVNRLAGAERVLRDRRLAATRAVQEPGPIPSFQWQNQTMTAPSWEQYDREYRPTLQQWRATVTNKEAELRNARNVLAQVATRDAAIREAMDVINRINVDDKFLQQAQLDQTLERVRGMKTRFKELSDRLVSMNREVCPTCNQMWAPGSAEINKEMDDLSCSISSDEEVLQRLQKEHANWMARLHEVRIAQEKLKANQNIQLPLVDMDQLERELGELRTSMTQYETWCQAVANYLSKVEFWRERNEAAVLARDTRSVWDRAVKAVEDPTFKSELVLDPMDRVRRRLLRTGQIFQRRVDIQDDLSVSVDGREWWLLSEAQKLETSVMLADAFAHAGGSKILKIDGVDTLVGAYQIKLLEFIKQVKGDYDTILIALASEQTPAIYQRLFVERQQQNGYVPLARWFWMEENQCRYREDL